MRIDHRDCDRIEIALSERNLIALLNKVRRDGSFRTLEFEGPVNDDDGAEHTLLVVRAEPDDEHYGGRETPPGEVYPGDLEEPLAPRDEQPTRIISLTYT